MSESSPNPCQDVIGSLSAKIDRVAGPLLPGGDVPVALLDFPNHYNVGDSAIWLGETDWLRRQRANVSYVCDVETYSKERLAARIGERGVILLHGGGNLGDFWYHHQQFRERVIQDFPANRIIQLPQTIYFVNAWAADQCATVFNSHPDLTILCRDQPSIEFARKRFDGARVLCPDMALALGPIPRPQAPAVDVFWLARTDTESLGAAAPGELAGVERDDWLEEGPSELRDRNHALSIALKENPADWQKLQDDLGATYDPLARERVARGCRLLSRGRAVITDRLHGHILCTLLGIPHVVLATTTARSPASARRGRSLARWRGGPNHRQKRSPPLANSLIGFERVRRHQRQPRG